MEAGGSSSSCGAGTGELTVDGLTQRDQKQLVDSTIPFRGSVVRIIRVSKKKDVIETGTAFLVFRGEKRSLFLTCDHKFMKRKMGEVIRFSNGDKKNYPVEKILYRDGARDLLLFSVKGDVPENPCVEFSTDKIEKHDKVVLVGYCTPMLPDKNGVLVQALVKEPGLYTGRISTAFRREDIQEYYEKITYNFPVAEGVGGAPLLRNGKVIGVHLARYDRNWKDGVSAGTVLQVLREWLGIGEDNQATIKELLQMVYDKIEPNVPNVELSTSRKKLRSESKQEEGSNHDVD